MNTQLTRICDIDCLRENVESSHHRLDLQSDAVATELSFASRNRRIGRSRTLSICPFLDRALPVKLSFQQILYEKNLTCIV